jgi:hypothetical protein
MGRLHAQHVIRMESIKERRVIVSVVTGKIMIQRRIQTISRQDFQPIVIHVIKRVIRVGVAAVSITIMCFR